MLFVYISMPMWGCLITKRSDWPICLAAGGDTRPSLPAGRVHGAGSLHRGALHPRTNDSGCQDVPGAEEKRQPDGSARQHATSGQRRGLRASPGGQHCVTIKLSSSPRGKQKKTSERKPLQSLPGDSFLSFFKNKKVLYYVLILTCFDVEIFCLNF